MSPKRPIRATATSKLQPKPVTSGRITRPRKHHPTKTTTLTRISNIATHTHSHPPPEHQGQETEGHPPAWAENRPELCDALPWFRSVQGGVYHNGNICWGFLIDADCGIRSYLDDEVVITRVGGGCTKDANGNLVLIKDQDGDSAAMSSILNSMELKVPVGIVIGE
ncbi:hypothetical protein AtubIFM54640_006680 [Aspergillus tubingensis]|nr:hypothetical protein AtubIFM54640_006680 [Aspergillus tubingensis]